MSNGSWYVRLWNALAAFFGAKVEEIEQANPEGVYLNSINNLKTKYAGLKAAAGRVYANKDGISNQLNAVEAELASIPAKLDLATSSHQDDLGVALMGRQEELEKQKVSLTADLEAASKSVDEVKESLIDVENQIHKLKSEKDEMVAKFKSAEAQASIHAQLDGLSVDSTDAALENVRSHIKGTIAESKLGDEVHDANLDVRLGKLAKAADAQSAKAKFEAYKQQKALEISTASKLSANSEPVKPL